MKLFPNFPYQDLILNKTKESIEEDTETLKDLVKDSKLFSESEIFQTSQDWSLLLRGLVHPENLTKKRSLYLLKRLVEHLNLDKDIYDQFFLILDTVDEKQVHLVKQVFGHIANLWKIQDFLPFNLITQRLLFKHQNQAIAKGCLIHFLKNFDQSLCKNQPCFIEFIRKLFLMGTLNQSIFN